MSFYVAFFMVETLDMFYILTTSGHLCCTIKIKLLVGNSNKKSQHISDSKAILSTVLHC